MLHLWNKRAKNVIVPLILKRYHQRVSKRQRLMLLLNLKIMYLKTYSKWNVQPFFTTYKMDQNVVYCNIKGLHMHQNLLWNFLNSFDVFIFSTGLYVNGTLLFCMTLLVYWICKIFYIHKINLIVQKWTTISIYMSKFYIIKSVKHF
jgi:hypothetical protein